VEITEARPVAPASIAERVLCELSAAGIRLALDDFGAGYSSLEYLTRLPANFLKLDRDLIARLPTEERARIVVGGVLRICDEFGVQVIAEGVETETELSVCRDLGVSLVQGYCFARPAPLESFTPAARLALSSMKALA
jgi:EAL domain-containing protein (putative c-di-GMP-specific phosphodiesterase class I)